MLKPVIEKEAKDKQIQSGGAVPQKSAKPPIDTRQEIAKLAGVSHDTVCEDFRGDFERVRGNG